MLYEIVLEESFQPAAGGRAYHSETVIRTMLSLLDAKLECAEYNVNAFSGQYYSYRQVKESK
jgi:hypothetical protein